MTSEPELDLPELDLPGLARSSVRRTRPTAVSGDVASVDPVARVLVDTPLAHLDRDFDYLIPAALSEAARPGVRVKVRFAGREAQGFLLSRSARSAHSTARSGPLSPLSKVVSAEPVLSPEIARLAGVVAAHYAGTRADVVRLAVPPRHARVEAQPGDQSGGRPASGDAVGEARHGLGRGSAAGVSGSSPWAGVERVEAFLRHLGAGGGPRALWPAAPGDDWPAMLAAMIVAAFDAGRGAVACLPDRRDVDRLDAALGTALGTGRHVVLRAQDGPAARYRNFLRVSRGSCRVVIGTRSAAFAPVRDLGLAVIWDDGDDLHAEPRAPYPHVREVLRMRAELEGCALLLGGFAISADGVRLSQAGPARAHSIAVSREAIRLRARIVVAGEAGGRDPYAGTARVPRAAHEAIKAGLASGSVLVQVPRAGYAPGLACETCRARARCRRCAGPLRLGGGPTGPDGPWRVRPPECRWCGQSETAWACPECGYRGLRAAVVGDRRTAEELGRAFPGVPVAVSDGAHPLDVAKDAPGLVIATPGAEPVARGGYRCVVLLDTGAMVSRPELRAEEEAVRRWLNAAGMVGPGGSVVVVGDSAHPAIQAVVRWDSTAFAERQLTERGSAGFPPRTRMAVITGPPGAVDDALTMWDRPAGADVLGPAPDDRAGVDGRRMRAVLRVPAQAGQQLASSLAEVQRLRSARKLDPIRIHLDPATL
ncbi:MAG: primosome assembly protein PriA [Nocardioides sp.]